MTNVRVIFQNKCHNYQIHCSGTLQEIKDYFVGKCFDRGGLETNKETGQSMVKEDLQTCIGIEITFPKFTPKV